MENPREYLEAFIQRTSTARVASQLTQEKIAHLLGIGRNTYAQYERAAVDRLTIMPIHLVPTFCHLTGVSIEYMLTGRENPVIAAYNATEGHDRMIVDRFLRLDKDAALEPSLHDTITPKTHPAS